MRVAVVKPDWGITGGFELVAERIVNLLEEDGHRVDRVNIPAPARTTAPFGIPMPNVSTHEPEFANYMGLLHDFSTLDLRRADAVISMQPPSYAVDHPRHLALFYHHWRRYYDLSDVLVEYGHVREVEQHLAAAEAVRLLDARYLSPVRHIAAGSEEVARRLEAFTGRRNGVTIVHAGMGFDGTPHAAATGTFKHALCISRHEFPKRVELFVQAMHIARDVPGISVGSGGRLGQAIQLDAELAAGRRDPAAMDRHQWFGPTLLIDPVSIRGSRRVEYRGRVDDDELHDLLGSALCVVAPAYLEDYGLTAVEAMAYGKPLIVCRDGGNLVEFVEDGVNGFVVDPTPAAIAAAITTLQRDPDLARQMGAAARSLASEYTWERTAREFGDAFDRATDA